MQSSILSANLDAKISGVQEFGISGRPGYFRRPWSVDSPDGEQGLCWRLHSQSDGRFEIGDIRESQRIEGYCPGNVLTKNILVNPNAFGHLRP